MNLSIPGWHIFLIQPDVENDIKALDPQHAILCVVVFRFHQSVTDLRDFTLSMAIYLIQTAERFENPSIAKERKIKFHHISKSYVKVMIDLEFLHP